MTPISNWLRQLIATIFLAGLLEMILPSNELKKVTKMIAGLLILMILIQPLAAIFKITPEVLLNITELIEESSANPSTEAVVAEGLRIREIWNAPYLNREKKLLDEKLKNIIGLIEEVNLLSVESSYQGSYLKKVSVRVEPVQNGQSSAFRARISKRVRQAINLVSTLNEDQIEVVWSGEKY